MWSGNPLQKCFDNLSNWQSMTHSACHLISITKSLATQGAGCAGVLGIFMAFHDPKDPLLLWPSAGSPFCSHPYTEICPLAPGTDVQSLMHEQCKAACVTPNQTMERMFFQRAPVQTHTRVWTPSTPVVTVLSWRKCKFSLSFQLTELSCPKK